MSTDNKILKRLPTATQEFTVVREENMLYVDKTDLMWQMANADEDVVFFSRPRRFGKTLLVSALEAYFKGQKELFEGLKIMDLEKDWKAHEVLRFDLSGSSTALALTEKLSSALDDYEKKYHVDNRYTSIGVRFGNVIKAAGEGKRQVVVLVDEYDYPLQHTLFGDAAIQKEHEACKVIYRDFFAQLKAQSRYIRYIFLTGITKFTQLSLFSVLNNIKIIGLRKQYQALCGITEEEVRTTLLPYVDQLAQAKGLTTDQAMQHIKAHYDGYHFCENGEDIYNPFSLINALHDKELNDYWTQSGGTKMLMDAVSEIGWDGTDFDDIFVEKSDVQSSDVNTHDLALFLYQSGYLTIKGSDEDFYYLGIPNAEVRKALNKQILPRLVGKIESVVSSNINLLKRAMRKQHIDEAMTCLKALVADTPYSRDNSAKAMEEKFQFIVKNAMFLVGCNVQEEKTEINGRADLVCTYDTCILIMELKMANNGGVAEAEKQLKSKDYAAPFMAQSKPVYGIALEFDTDKRCMTHYSIEKIKE